MARRGLIPRLLLLLLLGVLLFVTNGAKAEEEEAVVTNGNLESVGLETEAVQQMGEAEDDFGDELSDSIDDTESDAQDGVVTVESVNMDAMTEEELAAVKKDAEPHEFQAEVYRLMDIIINSLYTRKDVFLRELISNAADALEKVRFLAIENDEVLGETRDLKITIEYDTDAKTVTIADSGIGMTKEDLINNLGTVAKSGTSNFLEAIAKGGDVNLIGQFGVGFYSAFLVADKVTVTSKSNDDPNQHIWESTADASFSVARDPRGATLGRGTRITLHLKDDATDFLKKSTINELLQKYSQFVNFPIFLRSEKLVTEEVPIPVEEDKVVKDEEDGEVKDEEKEEQPKTKKVTKTVHELKKINLQKPIWMRPKDEVTVDEYNSFYRNLVKDEYAPAPLTQIHFVAEGEIEFRSILYVPGKSSADPYDQYFNKKHDIKLYVRRVLVGDQFEDIIPNWLGFVKGVIDSDDLPLKVDRESVSQTKVIKVISKRVSRKILDVLRKLASESEEAVESLRVLDQAVRDDGRVAEEGGKLEYNDEEKSKKTELETVSKKYNTFWTNFGKNVKLGCVDDDGSSRTKIAKLLRYKTSKSGNETVSLQKVVDRMAADQSSLYYLTGETDSRMMNSPLIKGFLKRDIEVLLLSDAVDEACIGALRDFDGKKLVSIEKGDVVLDQTEEDKEYFKKLTSFYKPLTKWWKKNASPSAHVSKVQLSHRLTDEPVGLAASAYGTTAFGEKLMRYQTFVDPEQMLAGRVSKILEINAQHPIIRKMKMLHEGDENSEELKTLAADLLDAAMLASGYSIENPAALASKMYKTLNVQFGVAETTEELVDLSDFEAPEGESDPVDDGPAPGGFDMSGLENQLSPEQMEQIQRMMAEQKAGGGDQAGGDAEAEADQADADQADADHGHDEL